MHERAITRLYDAQRAALQVQQFVDDQTQDDFLQDRYRQLAVHRLFELVGQALNRAKTYEPGIMEQVPNTGMYIRLQDDLYHRYDTVDYANLANLWELSQREIPKLISRLDDLLARETRDDREGDVQIRPHR